MIITPDEIRYHRACLGLTQEQLAGQLDVSPQALRHWEAGRRECRGPAAVLLRLLHERARPAPGAPWRCSRPRYEDLDPGDWAAAAAYDWCELKHDGCYGEIRGGPDGWEMRSRRGSVLEVGSAALPPCCVLIERITATEWARAHAPAHLQGDFVAWSALGADGQHLPLSSFTWLLHQLREAFSRVPHRTTRVDIDAAPRAWDSLVELLNWEGLVFRSHDGRFARMKKRVTRDFVLMGSEHGPGTLSAVGGLYNRRGKLVRKVSVPLPDGMPLKLAGAVFETSGLGVLASGALRNPRFERWRDDKPAEECTT